MKKRKRVAIPETHQYVKPTDVSLACGWSRPWIYERIHDGRIRAFLLDGVLRIHLADALRFIEDNVKPFVPTRTQDGEPNDE